jgi:hypothetical protein
MDVGRYQYRSEADLNHRLAGRLTVTSANRQFIASQDFEQLEIITQLYLLAF